MLDKNIDEEQIKKVRRAYFKEWRKKNPDKVKKHNQDYWAKLAAKQESEAVDNNDAENK